MVDISLLPADLPLRLPLAATWDGNSAIDHKAFPRLAPGKMHEWFFAHSSQTTRLWHPPLTVLSNLALQAAVPQSHRIVWIGRACWPTVQILIAGAPGDFSAANILGKCLFLDPLTDAERFWSIGQALRCPGIGAVVADGSGMNATVSRRLQLAAESGQALALLARPACEIHAPSWAATRWQIRPQTPNPDKSKEDRSPSWEIELLSCRGQHREQDAPRTWIANWSYQVFRGTGALHLSARVGCGTARTQENREFRVAQHLRSQRA